MDKKVAGYTLNCVECGQTELRAILKEFAMSCVSNWHKSGYAIFEDKAIAQILPLFPIPELKDYALQDILLGLTVLNQNSPKILLTNDEAGWYAVYLPDPPTEEGKISVLGDDPLDAIGKLQAQVDDLRQLRGGMGE